MHKILYVTQILYLMYLILTQTVLACHESKDLVLLAYTGKSEEVLSIIETGAELNQLTGDLTPLIAAVKKRRYHLVKLLLENKAKVDIKNDEGLTALMYAAQLNDTAIVQLLLLFGADPFLTNNNGTSAIDIAKITRNKKIINTLVNSRDRNEIDPYRN
ncbi:MAG: ankyrin repeat domain-containing protein [Gammaproteobacteria bacterium]|nr:ankyrin repeat domain-containing protein [Gammaproteobacteria bacterium]